MDGPLDDTSDFGHSPFYPLTPLISSSAPSARLSWVNMFSHVSVFIPFADICCFSWQLLCCNGILEDASSVIHSNLLAHNYEIFSQNYKIFHVYSKLFSWYYCIITATHKYKMYIYTDPAKGVAAKRRFPQIVPIHHVMNQHIST